MLRFFFNRTSAVVRGMEIIGLFEALFLVGQGRLSSLYERTLFGVLFFLYVFIRFCDLRDWYAQVDRKDYPSAKIGIQVHFQKAMVPTSYILGITTGFLLFKVPLLSSTLLLLSCLMLIVVGGVNLILIYFHIKDSDTLPINFFSANLYKKSEKPHLRIASSEKS